MSVRNFLIIHNRLRSGWRILLFLGIVFPPLYFLTYLFWEELLLRYFIIFWLLLFLSFISAKYLDKRPIATIGFSFHTRFMKEYIQGVAIGFIMVSLMFFLEMILGFLQINFKQITISLLKDILVISLLITLFQSAFEELFFRGYIFQNLIESTNKLFAIILLSVLFGIGHMLTPNSSWIVAINLSMFGVMHAIAYLKTRSLFLASGLHFSWNFSMRNIYSLPVSGTGSSHSFLEVQVKGPEWITGSNYGPEAGIPALLLMIICSLIIWYSPNIKIETNIKNHWEEYKAKYIFNGNN